MIVWHVSLVTSENHFLSFFSRNFTEEATPIVDNAYSLAKIWELKFREFLSSYFKRF